MPKKISVHSFRGGTGKSNTTANISTLMAERGLRVGVVDSDIQSPGIHVLFGLAPEEIGKSLNDYLWGNCSISETAYNMTSRLGKEIRGELFLIPSSMNSIDIARVSREGYDVGLLNDGFNTIVSELKLDVLMIDTHPGLREETLLSIAISDVVLLIMRPDQQDIQGTAVTVDVARKLDVPNLYLLVNKTPSHFDFDQIKKDMENAYDCEVAAILPHSDEMMILGGKGIFSIHYPDNPLVAELSKVADMLGD